MGNIQIEGLKKKMKVELINEYLEENKKFMNEKEKNAVYEDLDASLSDLDQGYSVEYGIPEHRYICENKWEEEFGMKSYCEDSDQLQADKTSWEEMNAFAKKKAYDYGLPKSEWYRFVWTSIDTDNGLILSNGVRVVNRIDYWFSKKPWGCGDKSIDDKTMIEIAWEGQDDCGKKKTVNK